MKKITVLIIILLMIFSLQTVFAEENSPETFATSMDLWNCWQNQRAMDYDDPNPYPEYITGVWTEDNMATLTFGVTEDERGEKGKAELLELIEDDGTVRFAYQKYPYNELWELQLKLEEQMGEETGVFGLGIYEMENHLHIDIDENNKNSAEFMKECFAEYGDKIVFEKSDGISVNAEETGYADGAGSIGVWLPILASVTVIMWTIVFVLKRKKKAAERSKAEVDRE